MFSLKLFVALFLASPLMAASATPAFQLYPATNDATPTVFTKPAPPFQTQGKSWKFDYGTKVTFTIDASKILGPVTPYQFGNNASWWSGKDWFLDPDRIEKAKEAGIKFWRWPGGSSSDNYHWDGNYGSHVKDGDGNDTAHMTGNWSVQTDDFINFCRQTGSEAVFTVNYAAARYMDVNYAADMAARWVKHCNIDMKFKVRYWEIGNELYGPWEEGNTMPGKDQLTGGHYGKDFRVIADAMKKVDPDIYVGAVAYEKDGLDEWVGHHRWTATLLSELEGRADFLILHQYFLWPFDSSGKNYTDPSNDVLFGNLHGLSDDKASLSRMIDQNEPDLKGIPVALTEYNIVNASPPPTIELINGLYTAEILGEAIKTGYAASNYWDWKNGLDAKLHGDMAMLASGDPSTPDGTPRPSYYAFALYSRAFGDKMVSADSSSDELKIYASRFSGGEMGIVIVNQSDRPKTGLFNLSGFAPQGKLMGWVLTGKGLNETQVSWDGTDGPLGGGGPFPINPIEPYRGTFDAAKPLALPIPARSACGIILY